MSERLLKSIGADWAVDWLPFGCKSVKCQMPLPFCLPMHLDGLSRGPVVQWSNGPVVSRGPISFLIFGHYEMATPSVGECALINATNCTHTIFNGVESVIWLWYELRSLDLHRFSDRDSHTLFMCIVRAK